MHANALDREGVKAGDRIGIKYLGEAEAENGTAYKDYRVAVDRSL